MSAAGILAGAAMLAMFAHAPLASGGNDASTAIEALDNLRSAVSVGLNLDEYNRRLIDTKIRAEPATGGNEDLAVAVRTALEAYQNALDVWRWKIRFIELKSRQYDFQYLYFSSNTEVSRWVYQCPAAIVREPSKGFLGSEMNGSWAPDLTIDCFWRKAADAIATAKQATASASPTPAPQAKAPPADRLRELKKLLDQKLITEDDISSAASLSLTSSDLQASIELPMTATERSS